MVTDVSKGGFVSVEPEYTNKQKIYVDRLYVSRQFNEEVYYDADALLDLFKGIKLDDGENIVFMFDRDDYDYDDTFTIIVKIRRSETDDEYKIRLQKDKYFDTQCREERRQTYLKLKEEFENE